MPLIMRDLEQARPSLTRIRNSTVQVQLRIATVILLVAFVSPVQSGTVIDRFNFFRVTREDELILVTADKLLKDYSAWNQFDDRKCEDDRQEGKWSLYCALVEACYQITGVEDTQRAAIHIVRRIIDHASRGKVALHPLMSFNNSANTGFADVKKVLSIAINEARKQLIPENRIQGCTTACSLSTDDEEVPY
jgi:hypothetical protein